MWLSWQVASNRLKCGLCNRIIDDVGDRSYWSFKGGILYFHEEGHTGRTSTMQQDSPGKYKCVGSLI